MTTILNSLPELPSGTNVIIFILIMLAVVAYATIAENHN